MFKIARSYLEKGLEVLIVHGYTLYFKRIFVWCLRKPFKISGAENV